MRDWKEIAIFFAGIVILFNVILATIVVWMNTGLITPRDCP